MVVAESSARAADRLEAALAEGGAAVVVARPRTGPDAVEAILTLRPDLALLRPTLPGLDARAIARIVMAEQPTPLLVVAAPPVDPATAAGWIEDGVLDVVLRPAASASDATWRTFAERLRAHCRLLAGIRVIRHVSGVRGPLSGRFSTARRAPAPGGAGVPLVGIVASTGGPPAVAQVLRDLGPAPPGPILLVQHIGAGFVASLAEWLGREVGLPVHVGREGVAPRVGHVYLAPAHAHLALAADGTLRLDHGPPDGLARPSGDVLLRDLSAQAGAGRRVVGTVLTGIGADGAQGLKALRDAGGWTIAQDEASSAVWGMPRAAVEAGAACEVLPLAAIGARLRAALDAPAGTLRQAPA